MRVVDEIPPARSQGKYDYHELDRLIGGGCIVAFDASEYEVDPHSLATNLRRWAARHHKATWRIVTRGHTVFVRAKETG